MRSSKRAPFREGGLLALLSALAFGATAPLVQRFGRGVGPFTTAALLYAGALVASLAPLGPAEVPVRRRHLPRLLVIAVAGAVLAPASLAWGLQRAGGASASLLLNFEAVFTVLLARLVHKEPIGRRAAFALALMTAGGALLILGTGVLGAPGSGLSGVAGSGVSGDLGAGLSASGAPSGAAPSIWGAIAVATATLFWAADNTLTRPLSDLDPARVVRWKAGLGAALSAAIALARKEPAPAQTATLVLLACGATGYGLSLRLYLLAQRRIGAARTGSVFAAAPFIGALVAWPLTDRALDLATCASAILFAAGVALHLTEKHEHAHTHAPLTHEHAHTHDDGHHDHPHSPAILGPHTHVHTHTARTHSHPHAPDLHHEHTHEPEHEHTEGHEHAEGHGHTEGHEHAEGHEHTEQHEHAEGHEHA